MCWRPCKTLQFTAVHTSRSLRAPIQGQFWKLQNTCSFRISLLQALSGKVPSWVISSLSRGQIGWRRFRTGSKQSRQKRWPHSVCTGWRIAKRHIAHSWRLSRGCLNFASKPGIPARQVIISMRNKKSQNSSTICKGRRKQYSLKTWHKHKKPAKYSIVPNTAQNASLQQMSRSFRLFCTPIPVRSITLLFLTFIRSRDANKASTECSSPSACR